MESTFDSGFWRRYRSAVEAAECELLVGAGQATERARQTSRELRFQSSIHAGLELSQLYLAVALSRRRPLVRAILDASTGRSSPATENRTPGADAGGVEVAPPPRDERSAFWTTFLALTDDPKQTHLIYELRESYFVPRDPAARARAEGKFLRDPEFVALYRQWDRPPLSEPFDFDALGALAEDTLGGRLARWIDENGLDAENYPAPAGDGPLEFARHRMRKTHDIHHVLSGFDTSVAGECGILGVYLAQSANPSSLATVAALLTAELLGSGVPAAARALRRLGVGYRLGLRAERLSWPLWERHWSVPVAEVRRRFGIDPTPWHVTC